MGRLLYPSIESTIRLLIMIPFGKGKRGSYQEGSKRGGYALRWMGDLLLSLDIELLCLDASIDLPTTWAPLVDLT